MPVPKAKHAYTATFWPKKGGDYKVVWVVGETDEYWEVEPLRFTDLPQKGYRLWKEDWMREAQCAKPVEELQRPTSYWDPADP